MRYRLEEQHYHNDMLLDEGMEVGDNCPIAWRYSDGSACPPSRAMTPLDDEAKKIYKDYFKAAVPDRDPTKAIPLQGTFSEAKVPPKQMPSPIPPKSTLPAPPVAADKKDA